MAFIEEFHKSASAQTNRPHSTCSCGWKVAEREGRRVFQLDTYGSDARKDQGTVSQSIQVDEDRARQLVALLRKTFPTIS